MKHTDHDDPEQTAQKAVAALARELEKLSREVQALKGGMRQTASKGTVTELAKVVENLSETVMKVAAGGGKKASEQDPVRSWLRLPEDETAAQEVLSELVPWMQTVYLRYGDARETLPPCWPWHPEIVEELLWLMDAWFAAFYGPDASLRLVGDWHDRQRPGVMRRVAIYSTACDLPTHLDEAGQPATALPLIDQLDPFVTWWAGDRDNNGPAPTRDQIHAARRGGHGAGQAGGLTAVPQDGSY
ncbi:hypothetical protein [Kribbella jiaozuonensis]|uniref:DUF4913 domain-containing protein n=1 Tax=Kribbella jiaozuonensis TaxID=2575441 RepID=A0A4U3M5P4_9ACTN|nr:hypothetical protein [Kribbella jiaozuonensis]TKK79164.1 hypothetical protein FDA38_12085 [Kribbella jiaozuonensis]TKK83234.1 hypothetical protein FDA38_11040 [Kribbella jiaozuonensis]